MKKLILLFAFSSLVAVSQPAIQITKSMIDNPTKIKLSELVDDITFIRLETNKNNLVKYSRWPHYTKDFIYFEDQVFTWDGKWKTNIGEPGRGPYEEPMGVCFIAFKDGKFYSKHYKLIEYDINGKPTKKVKNLRDEEGERKNTGSTISVTGQLTVVGKYLFCASSDAAYFVNPENFETVKRIELIPNKGKPYFVSQAGEGHISYYRDNILLYYPYVDTLFYVKDKSLQLIWKLQIDKEIKMPLDYFHNIEKYIMDHSRGGKKRFEARAGKITINEVYETNNHLFFGIEKWRERTSDTSYICYDKRVKTSKVARKEDFVDDILGLGAYKLPKICDEKILMALWPHEIFDIIDKKKRAGEKIHPKLEALAKQIDEGDNPIIFVAHLKK